jgi:hypothetical protein
VGTFYRLLAISQRTEQMPLHGLLKAIAGYLVMLVLEVVTVRITLNR